MVKISEYDCISGTFVETDGHGTCQHCEMKLMMCVVCVKPDFLEKEKHKFFEQGIFDQAQIL
jgi:hypothetical protein